MRRGSVIPGGGLVQRTDNSSVAAVIPGLNFGRGTVALATAPSFAVDDFPTDMIYQRGTNGISRLTRFTGSYSGSAPTSVQIKLEGVSAIGTVQDYTVLSSFTAENGVWSGWLDVPWSGTSGVGWYKARAKHSDGTESELQNAQWSVGRRILITGASNMALMWANQTTGLTGGEFTRWIGRYSTTLFGDRYSDGWYSTDKSERGAADSGPIGLNALDARLRSFINAANPNSQETIGIVDLGIPGLSDAADFLTGQVAWEWFAGSQGINYPAIGPEFELILGEHGDPDGVEFALSHTQLLTLLGRTTSTLKFGLLVFNSFNPTFISDADSNSILSQIFATSQTHGFFLGPSMRDMVLVDDAHWNPSEYGRLGKRMAVAAANHWGLNAFGAEGPYIYSAYWVVGTTQIFVTLRSASGQTDLRDGTGSSSGTGLDGFSVTASGGQTISDVALINGQVVITMSAVRGAGQTVTLLYAQDANPYGFPFDGTGVVDDVAYDHLSTFLTDTQGFPLRSTFGTAITVSATAPETAVAASANRGAMYPGGWIPDRLYTPPRRKISKRKIEALKELYEEAREVIPEPLQVDLLPAALRSRTGVRSLPPIADVDFDALARSLQTIQTLIAAVNAAMAQASRAEEQKRLRRRREEETLILMLSELL